MKKDRKKPDSSTFPWKEILGFLGVILVAYISYLGNRTSAEIPIHATQTAEAKLTLVAQTNAVSNSVVIPTPTSANIYAPTEQPPLSYNFENSVLSGIGIFGGQWQIVDDGSGNHVFQIDNSNKQEWPGFSIGSTFSDGIIEYHVKYIDYLYPSPVSGRVNLFFRGKGTSNGYIFTFNPYVQRTELVYVVPNGGWSPPINGSMSTIFFQKNVWYIIRLEIKESSINIYLNGALLSTIIDDRFTIGEVSLSVGPNTTVQFDDISIIYHIP